MADRQYNRLAEREAEVDRLMRDTDVSMPELRRSLRLEKTIIIATSAIVEAIWKARY